MAFKLTGSSPVVSDDPEAMFRDMRARKIPGLLSHQADIIREYREKALAKQDVAFQLPTGSGKTLVGLVIAEWRRRKFGERALYLCPTKQLVHQVAAQAREQYGMRVHAFVGKKVDYDPEAKGEYLSGDALAIAPYSALFNIKPFFADPNLIILDDAHSAESYIADLWSIRVERYREEHKAFFVALMNALRGELSNADWQKVQNNDDPPWGANWVEKISTPSFQRKLPELLPIIDAHSADLDLRYSWAMIRDHLHACHLYVDARTILIRPLLSPSLSHLPFANAKQRIYMSATLGAGGELERQSGVPSIYRLSVPTGWDKQGIGRRFFLFPERSLKDTEVERFILDAVNMAGRSLTITPDDLTAKEIRELIGKELKIPCFEAREIENSKKAFTERERAAAVIANRYDGIDFPEEECRLLVVAGLPRAMSLQERFLITRMGAVALLNDRILTRIVQAVGRCTRSATDYSAIIIWGEEIYGYLLKREARQFLHPELQAELDFGIEQSKSTTLAELLENLKIFLEHGSEWAAADETIIRNRSHFAQKDLPATSELRASVGEEVKYQYALWNNDFASALESCRSVLAELKDPELRGYRAVWHYLAGSAAWLGARDNLGGMDAVARDYFRNAVSAAPALGWLKTLAQFTPNPESISVADSQLANVIERLEIVLQGLGTTHDRRYSEEERFILDHLASDEAGRFEQGHERLGRLLGYDAGNAETTGAPDPWWMADESLCFIFEDYSEAELDSSLSVTKARQVYTHPNWVRANLPIAESAEVMPVLITRARYADRDALPHLNGVAVWNLEEFRKWANNALSVIRELRRHFPGSGDLAWRADAAERFQQNNLDPKGIIQLLRLLPANSILKEKQKL
jgi:hypothetical protein